MENNKAVKNINRTQDPLELGSTPCQSCGLPVGAGNIQVCDSCYAIHAAEEAKMEADFWESRGL